MRNVWAREIGLVAFCSVCRTTNSGKYKFQKGDRICWACEPQGGHYLITQEKLLFPLHVTKITVRQRRRSKWVRKIGYLGDEEWRRQNKKQKKDVAVKLHFTFIFLLPFHWTNVDDIWLNRLKTIILFHCLILKSLNIHDLVVYSFFI